MIVDAFAVTAAVALACVAVLVSFKLLADVVALATIATPETSTAQTPKGVKGDHDPRLIFC